MNFSFSLSDYLIALRPTKKRKKEKEAIMLLDMNFQKNNAFGYAFINLLFIECDAVLLILFI